MMRYGTVLLLVVLAFSCHLGSTRPRRRHLPILDNVSRRGRTLYDDTRGTQNYINSPVSGNVKPTPTLVPFDPSFQVVTPINNEFSPQLPTQNQGVGIPFDNSAPGILSTGPEQGQEFFNNFPSGNQHLAPIPPSFQEPNEPHAFDDMSPTLTDSLTPNNNPPSLDYDITSSNINTRDPSILSVPVDIDPLSGAVDVGDPSILPVSDLISGDTNVPISRGSDFSPVNPQSTLSTGGVELPGLDVNNNQEPVLSDVPDPVFPSADYTPVDYTSSKSSVDYSAGTLDYPTSDLSNIQPGTPELKQNLGDGNNKETITAEEKRELITLLTLGLLGNQRGAATTTQNRSRPNPVRDLLSMGGESLQRLFNLLTLGIFNRNRGQSSGNSRGGFDLKDALNIDQGAIQSLQQEFTSGLDNIARDTASNLKLVGDEFHFMSKENIRMLIRGLQNTGSTLAQVGQNSYRSLLQKQDAITRLIMDLTKDIGEFANESVGKTFERVGDTATDIGQFITDIKVGILNALVAKGQAVQKLIMDIMESSGKAFNSYTSASKGAAEDNIKAIAGLNPYR